MSNKILVTGGAGFVGSHVSEYYAKKGKQVVVYDNISRSKLLEGADKKDDVVYYNWNFLKGFENIELVKGDIREGEKLEKVARDADVIIHTAGQVAVTASVENPKIDFGINALGTFNVLEAARKSENNPAIVYCSTNKVYGENVNSLPIAEKENRYYFSELKGVQESLGVDLCEHTPYGCSKLAGDLYVQDYGKLYGMQTAAFRMSCIYGTRQFGNEDQGWVAHFVISSLLGRPISVYGDGKQVRDVLYVSDLVNAFDSFLQKRGVRGEVFNIGGGPENTISLLELLDLIERLSGRKSKITFDKWRPSDQKVYISDVSKAEKELKWKPVIGVRQGVKELLEWANKNKNLF